MLAFSEATRPATIVAMNALKVMKDLRARFAELDPADAAVEFTTLPIAAYRRAVAAISGPMYSLVSSKSTDKVDTELIDRFAESDPDGAMKVLSDYCLMIEQMEHQATDADLLYWAVSAILLLMCSNSTPSSTWGHPQQFRRRLLAHCDKAILLIERTADRLHGNPKERLVLIDFNQVLAVACSPNNSFSGISAADARPEQSLMDDMMFHTFYARAFNCVDEWLRYLAAMKKSAQLNNLSADLAPYFFSPVLLLNRLNEALSSIPADEEHRHFWDMDLGCGESPTSMKEWLSTQPKSYHDDQDYPSSKIPAEVGGLSDELFREISGTPVPSALKGAMKSLNPDGNGEAQTLALAAHATGTSRGSHYDCVMESADGKDD